MPRLTYISRGGAESAGFRPVSQQGLDLSPLAEVAQNIARDAAQLREVQQRESERLRADELRMSVANTLSETQVSWTERVAQAKTQAPADAKGFTESLIKDFDTYTAEALGKQKDPQAQRLLTDGFRRMRLSMHADAFNFEIGQRKRALVDSAVAGIETDRRGLMANPSAFTDTLAKRLAAIQTLDIAPAEKEKLLDGARRGLSRDAAMALVDQNAAGFLERAGMRAARGKRGGSRDKDAAEAVASDPLLSSMHPDDLRQVVDRASLIVAQQEAAAQAEAERRARLAEIEAARKQRAADQALSILAERARFGIATDPSDRELFAAIEGMPHAAEYRRLAALIPKQQALAMLPIAKQREQIDQLLAYRQQQGTNTGIEEELKRRQEIVTAAEKAYREDPLGATQRYGLQTVAPIDTTSLQGFLETVMQRVPQADVARQVTGTDESPLRPSEVPDVQAMFSTLAPAEQGKFIAEMAARVPPGQMQSLARQIGERDRPLSLAFAAGASSTDQGRAVAELIMAGAAKLKDAQVRPGGRGDLIKQQERTVMVQYLGEGPQAAITGETRKDILEAAELVNASFTSSDPERAVRLVLGGHVIDYRGRRLPVPMGMDQDDIEAKLMQYPRAKIDAQASDGWVMLPGRRPMGVPEFLAELPNAQLEPVGQFRYAVRAGGSLVMNAERRPIVVDLR